MSNYELYGRLLHHVEQQCEQCFCHVTGHDLPL